MAIDAKFTRTLPAPTATISSGFVFLLSAGWFSDADLGAAGSPIGGGANSIANGGGDMQIFSETATTTRLPREVVTFVTGGSPEAQVWVRTPSYTSGDTITIGRDDTQTTQPAVGAAFGRNATWSSGDYSNHMDGTGLLNSTNGSTGVFESGTPTQVSAQIEDGRDFVSEGIATGESFLGSSSDFTISAWVRWDGGVQGFEGSIVDSWAAGNTSYMLRYESSGGGSIEFFVNDGSSQGGNFASTSLQDSSLHFIHARLSGGFIEVFKDGVKSGTSFACGAVTNSTPANFKIGRSIANNGGNDFFQGVIDEVVIYESKTDAYISSEYDNQSDPDNFGTSSEWVLVGGGGISITGATANYNYSGIDGSVDLTGEIIVTGATASYSYDGVTGSVDLTGEVIITGQTANYNYAGIDGDIELTGLITVTGQTANYDYDGIAADIILQGSIIITGSTANYDYNALNGTIIIQGPITVNPKNIIRVKRKSNMISVKRKSNMISVKRKSNKIIVR